MSAIIPRAARQVVSRRLLSTQRPLQQVHASALQELRAIFKPSMGVKPQPADYGKMIRVRATTFAIYATGMTAVFGWPFACQVVLNGHI